MLSSKTFIVFCLTLTIFNCEMFRDVMASAHCFDNKEITINEVLKQDLKCVCEYSGRLGKTCRFATKADTNFSGLSNADSIKVTWKDEPTTNELVVRHRIAIRRLFPNGNHTRYGKWRKLAVIGDELPQATLKTYLFQIPLRNGTYELKLDSSLVSGDRTTTSVLLSRSEPKLQPFTQIFEQPQSTCYRNGAIVGASGGALGSCILTLLLVVLIIKCRQKCVSRRRFKSTKVPQFFANPNFREEDTCAIQLQSQSDVNIDMTGATEPEMIHETNVDYQKSTESFDHELVAITVVRDLVDLCFDRAMRVQPKIVVGEPEKPVWTGSKIITTV